MMIAKATLALAFAGTCYCSAAMAEQHNVEIVEGGFFPSIIYLSAGDTVVFTNSTGNTQQISASDLSWTTGSLSANATYMLPVSAATAKRFTYLNDPEKAGDLSFDPAPLN